MKALALAVLLLQADRNRDLLLNDLHTQTVEYRHGEAALEGYLAYNRNQAGKRPGVVVVHEWRGHNPYVRRRAEELAKLGYVAFAIDMYGKGVYAKDHAEAGKMSGVFRDDRALMRGRAKAGLDLLLKHELCDPKRVAAMGYCFGGTTALELARAGADLAGAASFHGNLSTPTPADAKNIKGKVIIFHGADDPFIPKAQVEAFHEEMKGAGVDWQLVAFGGAVHSFTVKEAGNDPRQGMAYHEAADRRSWEMLKHFLAEVLK